MTIDVYDEFLDGSGRDERSGQREAVRLLVELSDAPSVDAYAIQAPTGTGKSYAALLAGVHNYYRGRRTIIGTSTVVLSDQYVDDISVVSAVFPDVTFAVLKGANNYFCGHKAAAELKASRTEKRKQELMNTLRLFRAGRLDYNPAWAVADTDHCLDCAEKLRRTGHTECQYARARAAALNADVVVTTHAMINIDARMRAKGSAEGSSILGRIWLTVFDEAHKASASLIYDETFSLKNVERMRYMGLLRHMRSERRDAFVNHFSTINESEWYEPSAALAAETLELWPSGVELSQIFDLAKNVAEKEKPLALSWVHFMLRTRHVLLDMADGDNAGRTALWAVAERQRDGTIARKYKLKEMIPEPELVKTMQAQRTAWLSATIGTESKPTYSLEKCGLRPRFFSLPSPFDYSKQLAWTIRAESMDITQGDLVTRINNHWPGGTVVLTPYHKRKEKIASAVRMADRSVLVQEQTANTTSNNMAVSSHVDVAKAGGRPVLVGVEIFSTGIDMPGEQLTKLVIADLFPIREDYPFIAWRSRWIEQVGMGDAFRDYILPERAITLEQQIGRVIRRVQDWGVVVFYLGTADCKPGSRGQQIIEEALRRFPGAKRLG